jgi:hypothetical protein
MSDFEQTSVARTFKRKLTSKWDTIVNFNAIISSLLTNNPWGCTSYTSAGQTLAGVRQTGGYFSGKVVYENTNGKQIGTISIKAPDSTAFGNILSKILSSADLTSSMGGTPSHDSSDDAFNAVLTCHDTNGEVYKVAFTRENVTLSGFEADSILTGVETWADNQPALA